MEAIKSSVEANLGVAFLSTASLEKEVALGRLSALTITGTPDSSLHPPVCPVTDGTCCLCDGCCQGSHLPPGLPPLEVC